MSPVLDTYCYSLLARVKETEAEVVLAARDAGGTKDAIPNPGREGWHPYVPAARKKARTPLSGRPG
ncbi:MAG: hypothetical protein J5I98_01145 [Phaeodactylibacter sp.]|nr:hypothetical protein [Phaeodactylibacter sp.]